MRSVRSRAFDPSIREQRPYEYRVVRPDGEVRRVRAHGQVVFDGDGPGARAVSYIGTMQDVTDERRIADQLRAYGERLQLALDAGRMAVWAVDLRTGAVEASTELNRLVGLPEDAQPTLAELQAQYYPGDLDRLQDAAIAALGRGSRFFETDYRHIRADDGAVRWLALRAEFQMAADGTPVGVFGVVFDITERKADEERLRLLSEEVNHRANNLLAVIQAAIGMTRADTPEAYRKVLLGRVAALGRAHQLLASSRWHGADLKRLIEEELRPYSEEGDQRVTLTGDHLEVSPAVAQGVALAVHELTTNAVKHGALSKPGAHLSVAWTCDGQAGHCLIEWRESGVPISGDPMRPGVGTKVLQRALTGSAAGKVELEWRHDGLIARLQFKAA